MHTLFKYRYNELICYVVKCIHETKSFIDTYFEI